MGKMQYRLMASVWQVLIGQKPRSSVLGLPIPYDPVVPKSSQKICFNFFNPRRLETMLTKIKLKPFLGHCAVISVEYLTQVRDWKSWLLVQHSCDVCCCNKYHKWIIDRCSLI